jgi:hypothetical protein
VDFGGGGSAQNFPSTGTEKPNTINGLSLMQKS